MRFIRYYKYYACRSLAKLNLLPHLSFNLSQKFGAQKFRVPVIDGIGYHNLIPVREEWMDTIIQKLFSIRNGCVIDVGVNLGQTLLKIASFNTNINYYGFEPNPVCYAYCKSLIRANHLNTFRIFPVGLSSTSQIVKLFGDNDHASGASMIENFRTNKERYKEIHAVPVMPADNILCKENIVSVNFIKVDVEGAELDVMLGFKETLKQFHPVIIIEILPVYTLENENGKMRKERQDKLLQLMFSLGYKLFLIHEKETKLELIEDISAHGDMSRTNYLFIPSTEVKNFDDLLISLS